MTYIPKYFPHFTFGSWSHCAYCGDIPTCREHAIPYTFISPRTREQKVKAFSVGCITPACSQCNTILGSLHFSSFHERSKFVCGKLIKKSKKVSAQWRVGETSKLDLNLRSYISTKQHERKILLQRAEWFMSTEYLLNLENLIYEPKLEIGHNQFHKFYFEFFRETIEYVTRCLNSREKRQGS